MKFVPACLIIALLTAFFRHANAAFKPLWAARSVHLFYHAPFGNIFFNTQRVEQSQSGSCLQVCGLGQGYFGLQELASKKCVPIFFHLGFR